MKEKDNEELPAQRKQRSENTKENRGISTRSVYLYDFNI